MNKCTRCDDRKRILIDGLYHICPDCPDANIPIDGLAETIRAKHDRWLKSGQETPTGARAYAGGN